jgi:hypothetical protein
MATSQALIENPVINSPFAEPQSHFRFSDEGIVLASFETGMSPCKLKIPALQRKPV